MVSGEYITSSQRVSSPAGFSYGTDPVKLRSSL